MIFKNKTCNELVLNPLARETLLQILLLQFCKHSILFAHGNFPRKSIPSSGNIETKFREKKMLGIIFGKLKEKDKKVQQISMYENKSSRSSKTFNSP